MTKFDNGVKFYLYFTKYFQRFSFSGVSNAGGWLAVASIQVMCHLMQLRAGVTATVLDFWQQLTGSQCWNGTELAAWGYAYKCPFKCKQNHRSGRAT